MRGTVKNFPIKCFHDFLLIDQRSEIFNIGLVREREKILLISYSVK